MQTQLRNNIAKEKAKFKNKQMAKKLGVSESYISLMISGKRKMTRDFLKLAKKYKLL